MIVAHDKCGGIAKNGKIPWKIPVDTQFFYDITTPKYTGNRNAIIMGNNTYKTLGLQTPLKNRTNIIFTRRNTTPIVSHPKGLKVPDEIPVFVQDIGQLLTFLEQEKFSNVFICGGREIYELLFHLVTDIYETVIKRDYNCDLKIDEILQSLLMHKRVQTQTYDLLDENIGETVSVNFNKYSIFPPAQICTDSGQENLQEYEYLHLLEEVVRTGDLRDTRNGHTRSLFGGRMEFNLRGGIIPILTTKKIITHSVIEELAFFLRGDTNTKHLEETGVNIWNQNTTREFLDKVGLKNYPEGDMGCMYGFQWLHFGTEYTDCNTNYEGKGLNQIEQCLDLIRTDPMSRRILLTDYNPAYANKGCLYPCHSIVIQFYVKIEKAEPWKNYVSCQMYQRSGDIFLGVPFNIFSTSLLLYILCEILTNTSATGQTYCPDKVIIVLGDCHLYEEHYNSAVRQLLHNPLTFPTIKFNRKLTNYRDFRETDISIENYNHYPYIGAKLVA